MNFRPSLLAGAIGAAVLLAGGSRAADAAELRFTEQPIQGQYIVVLKADAASLAGQQSASAAPQVAAVAQTIAGAYGARVLDSFEHALRGFVIRAPDDVLARMLMDDRIAYIEEDGVVHALDTQQNATWGLDRVDQRDLPLDDLYHYDTTASGVHAYIVDTGVRSTHNDFGGRVSSGYTAINDGRGTEDCNGHGTHVAGTVGGSTWGVAKGVTLHPVRVLGCNGSGSNSGVIAGVDWVTANHIKPAVANMSLGGGASSALDDAVENSIAAGVTYAVAAGNSNDDACFYSPARVGPALTVGSTTSSDSRSSFSSYGSCLDIFAPGSSITSAWSTGDNATNTISGTSMASPHVAGAAALYLAVNPSASPSQVSNALTDNASAGRIGNVGSGSPNLLLYTLSGGGDPDPDPTPDELQNGVPVSGLSGAAGSEGHFTMQVPAEAVDLLFEITGGSGDADMYVRFGAPPTTSTYDCRPYRNGNEETCGFDNPQAGTWYVMLHGYTAYSGVTLTGSYGTDGGGGGAPCSDCTRYSGSLSGNGDADAQPDGTYYYSTAGTHQGWLRGPASGADFDLELYRWNGFSWSRVARSISPTSEEHVSYNGSSGYYYWRIVSYSGSGSYEFWLQRP